MGNGMNKIMHGLYLGNFRDSRDVNQLADNKITHILSIHDNARPLNPDKIYLCLAASDMPNQDIAQYFSECNDFIHKARLSGGNVLVHCLAGVSRSASIVVAYVMTVTNFNFRHALDAVRGARRCASPNFGFQRQLLEFQYERLAQERDRLRKQHGESKFPDQADCQVLLDIFQQSEQQLEKARTEYFVATGKEVRGDFSVGASVCNGTVKPCNVEVSNCHGSAEPADVVNGKTESNGQLSCAPEKAQASSSVQHAETSTAQSENEPSTEQAEIQDGIVSSTTGSGKVVVSSDVGSADSDAGVDGVLLGVQKCRLSDKNDL